MAPDTPVHTLDECFDYLQNNAWQFKHLECASPIRVNAQMLRSLYFHIGCAKFGAPDQIALLVAFKSALLVKEPSTL